MMKRVLAFLFLLALVVVPARAQQHLIGEVTAADAATGAFTVKTDAGESITVKTDDKTSFRRVPPGQTTLENAERITRADVSLGDRVLIPGGMAAGGAAARQLIVMSRSALVERNEREREDWRQRGISGRVVSIDAARQEIVVETRGRGGVTETLTIAASNEARFRRYAPDSLRPADAVPGTFSDIRVGDQLRARGDRSADGPRLTAEEVITGSVARVAGTIAAVDASRGEITVRDAAGQTFTVTAGQRTTLRRIPNDIAERFAQMRGGPNAGGQGRGRDGGGGRQTGEGRRERGERREAGQPSQTGQAGQPGQRGGERPRPAGGGLQQLFENLPVVTLADLRAGDAVMVTGTATSSTERMTAASLLTGSPELLTMLQRFGGGQGGRGNMSTGLPGNVMGGGTGGDRDDPRNQN